MKKITVFCGSSSSNNEAYLQATERLAQALVENEISLVCGGSYTGLMARLSDGILQRGGEVIAVIPEKMISKQLACKGLTVIHIVQTLQERKALIDELSDAYIALPGGIVTLKEMTGVFTHNKPCGLLNIAGYYDTFVEFMKTRPGNTFFKPEHIEWLHIEKDPAVLLQQMQSALMEYENK